MKSRLNLPIRAVLGGAILATATAWIATAQAPIPSLFYRPNTFTEILGGISANASPEIIGLVPSCDDDTVTLKNGNRCALGPSGGSCGLLVGPSVAHSICESTDPLTLIKSKCEADLSAMLGVTTNATSSNLAVSGYLNGMFDISAMFSANPCEGSGQPTPPGGISPNIEISSRGTIGTASSDPNNDVVIRIPFSVRYASNVHGIASLGVLAPGFDGDLTSSLKWSILNGSGCDGEIYTSAAQPPANAPFNCSLQPGDYTLVVRYALFATNEVAATCDPIVDEFTGVVNSGFSVNLLFSVIN